MKTITILVGNSDNKLNQVDWTRFCRDIGYVVENLSKSVEFSAPSIGWVSYQNACWVFTALDENIVEIKEKIAQVGKKYLQESVAYIIGDTEFLR